MKNRIVKTCCCAFFLWFFIAALDYIISGLFENDLEVIDFDFLKQYPGFYLLMLNQIIMSFSGFFAFFLFFIKTPKIQLVGLIVCILQVFFGNSTGLLNKILSWMLSRFDIFPSTAVVLIVDVIFYFTAITTFFLYYKLLKADRT